MKLARMKGEPRFYYVVAGDELFDFDILTQGELKPTMPLDSNEYLPAVTSLWQRTGLIQRHLERLESASGDDLRAFRRPLRAAELDAPARPPSFRDFYTFEKHVASARKRRGLDMVAEWYEAPVFYFSNTHCILGPADPVAKPAYTQELDFELEVAAVVGTPGKDIAPEQADSHIAGFTILNDWSARDVQRREMRVGLGPAKGKDFATSIGPYLVTPDELEPHSEPLPSRGRRYHLRMQAWVNGRQIADGNSADMKWTFAELLAQASRGVELQVGDLIGSGAVGTGCLVEFPQGQFPWLQVGDVVRLEIEGLGTLETRVAGQ